MQAKRDYTLQGKPETVKKHASKKWFPTLRASCLDFTPAKNIVHRTQAIIKFCRKKCFISNAGVCLINMRKKKVRGTQAWCKFSYVRVLHIRSLPVTFYVEVHGTQARIKFKAKSGQKIQCGALFKNRADPCHEPGRSADGYSLTTTRTLSR